MLCAHDPVLLVDSADATCRALITEANFLARPKHERHAVAATARSLPMHAVVIGTDGSAVFVTQTGVRLLNPSVCPLAIEFDADDLRSFTRTLTLLPSGIPNLVVPYDAFRRADRHALCQFRAIARGAAKLTVRDHDPVAPAWTHLDISPLRPTCAFWTPGDTATYIAFTPCVSVPAHAVVWTG